MYLHLGQDIVIKTDEVLGIFDLDTATIAKSTRDYLAMAEKRGRVVNVSMELPKSFVVCACREGGVMVYISQISSGTLLKRTNYIDEISNVN
ncbi:MAG: DUF370 domain-containing protein [Clostridiales bacterium]|jgi:hypothetical protein|nr:DUF370 domain-containing protein [Clostridiales bacterium]